MKPLTAPERHGSGPAPWNEHSSGRSADARAGIHVVHVGGWTVDRTANAIARAGNTVRVEPKVMDLLVELADHAGAVISRADLLAAVWPRVVVGDEVLTQSVIKLRRALGDNPRAPTFIETIPKRGYRLIASVADRDATPAPPGARSSWLHVLTNGRGRDMRSLVVALGIASVAIAGIYLADSRVPHVQQPPAGADRPRAEYEGTAGLPTVTVSRFATVGAGAEQAYLAQGISSDLTTDLSRLSEVRVINAFAKAGNGRAAGTARYVIGGSVQRDGALLRINVRLTDERTGEELWSRRYERPFGDLLAIQNEISRRLIERLPATLNDAERRRLAKRYTRSPEAYDDFLRGKALFLVRRPDANEQARAYFTKALDLDPQFARAYAALAMTFAMDYRYRRSNASAGELDRALELAKTARQIDSDMPEAYWSIGFVDVQSRRHAEALGALKRAIELNPSYADAYALMGGIYTYVGEPARSIPLLRTALRLNPDGGYLYFLLLGRAYLFENDLDQALFNLGEAVKRNPADVETHIYLAATLVAIGNRRAAEFEADEVRMSDDHFSMRDWLRTYPLTSPREAQRLLDLNSKVRL